MNEVILHHYPLSPVSEKVRVALGIKGLAWRSVEIPRLPPKPDVMPLTGGYRRTPIMQIGADIYCDSQCILRELQQRFPEPSFYPGGADGLPWGISRWTDALFDVCRAAFARSANAAQLPRSLRNRIARGCSWDRTATLKKLQADLPHLARTTARAVRLDRSTARRRPPLHARQQAGTSRRAGLLPGVVRARALAGRPGARCRSSRAGGVGAAREGDRPRTPVADDLRRGARRRPRSRASDARAARSTRSARAGAGPARDRRRGPRQRRGAGEPAQCAWSTATASRSCATIRAWARCACTFRAWGIA